MNRTKNTVLVTGGFDPIHSGHILLLKDAANLGNKLIVGVNSDEWLIRKKGFFFMPFDERKIIIQNLKMVNKVIEWDDNDNSAYGAIIKALKYIESKETLIFANGGDRNKRNIPELKMFNKDQRVKFLFGVGGNSKKNSSSQILENFENFRNNKYQ